MKFSPYDKVSLVYESLMQDVDYDNWANYILKIADTNLTIKTRALELASGDCKLARQFSNYFNSYFATDISLAMLKSAQRKDIKMICCDMSALPFKKKFNFIFCTFDSINYLLKRKQLISMFNEVSSLLERDGVFTFDVSLENNSIKLDQNRIVVKKFNGYEFQRTNRYHKHSRIHFNYFYISDVLGQKFKEIHKQKIYEINTYFKLSEKVGLYTKACYDCFTFKDVTSKSERAQFVMRKMN